MNYHVEIIKPNVYRIDEFGLGTMYFIQGSQKGLLIDTGTGVGRISDFLKTITTLPYDVVLTHGHVDHTGGINQFNQVYVHQNDLQLALSIDLKSRQLYATSILNTYPDSPFKIDDLIDFKQPTQLIPINENFTFDLGDKAIEVYLASGHTNGSIFLLDKTDKILFSGDSLQHLELLSRPNPSRKEVVEIWLQHIKTIKKYQNDFDTICGGHEPLEIDIIDKLIHCGEGIINNTLQPIYQQIHIFKGFFTTYQNVNITYQPMDEIKDF